MNGDRLNVRRSDTALFLVKAVHTLIFVFFAGCIGVVAYSALTGWITPLTWWAFGLTLLECAVFVGNGWRCPLTGYAERLGADNGSVADLFVPLWFARRLPWVAGTVFFAASLAVVIRAVTGV